MYGRSEAPAYNSIGVEKDTSSLSALSDDTTIAYKLFGAAKYDTESWVGWNGLTESETTYYDASTGEKLGSAFTSQNTFDNNSKQAEEKIKDELKKEILSKTIFFTEHRIKKEIKKNHNSEFIEESLKKLSKNIS